MRMKLPITGTVKEILEGGIVIGESDDPIRPVNVILGNVSWTMINLDIDNEEMEIEITPSDKYVYDTGAVDGQGDPVLSRRKATVQDKAVALEYARDLSLERKTKAQLYTLSGSKKLINPFKAT